MRYKIEFTSYVVLGPNGSRQRGVEGTYYIYDTQQQSERICYATTRANAELIRAALELFELDVRRGEN
jgi:hypothetical protein